MRDSIKITRGALDELTTGEIVLRGVLDPKSLHLIKTDDYQREVLPMNSLNSLMDAMRRSTPVPDVTLGMRGGSYLEREGALFLQDDTYVIDGLQRISAALHLIRSGQVESPHLGAVVYFNTTRESETEIFRILNTSQLKLSPNVLVRNYREAYSSIDMLFGLTQDRSFVLCNRICWQQRMRRQELLTAFTLLKTSNLLHATFGPGRSSRLIESIKGSEKLISSVGRARMRENLKIFFDVIDSAWGIRSVAFKEGAAYLKSGFLFALAMVLANHKNFWEDRKLVVNADMKYKLSIFPVNDPQVKGLAASGGSARRMLFRLLVDHMNSGKRTHRLRAFKESESVEELDRAEVPKTVEASA